MLPLLSFKMVDVACIDVVENGTTHSDVNVSDELYLAGCVCGRRRGQWSKDGDWKREVRYEFGEDHTG